ncbi:MAG: asparaginase [Pseudomonadota bacterium]
MSPEQQINPVLVQVTRGAQVESLHRGALSVVDRSGREVVRLGCVEHAVFPRSAVKALQALPLITTGAASRAGFDTGDLALSCASHSGAPTHTDRVARTLSRLDLTTEHLCCGAHWPIGPRETQDLARAGGAPTKLHNNCSGKHAGMLALAAAIDPTAVAGYQALTHSVQTTIRATLERYCDMSLADVHPAIDGCGAPNWPVPINALARAFAAFVSGHGTAVDDGDAPDMLMHACWDHPVLVAGEGRLDTDVLSVGRGLVFLKTGAEGVYCGGFPKLGLGFTLKIDDGATRASEAATLALINALYGALSPHFADRQYVRNWAGDVVGRVLPTPELADAVARLGKDFGPS